MASRAKYILAFFMIVALLLAVAAPMARPARAAVGRVIDNFTSGQLVQTVSGAPPQTAGSCVQDSDMIGGERDIFVKKVEGSSTSGIIKAQSGYDGAIVRLAHNQDDDTYGYTLVTWDGVDASCNSEGVNYTGLGSQSLTSDGSTGFYIRVVRNDQYANLVLTVWTVEADYSVYTLEIPTAHTTPVVYYIAFGSSSWVKTGNGADFGNVGAIQLKIDGTALASVSLDMSIDFIATNKENAVELASFTATPGTGGVQVAWTTDTEFENYGFNVYRAQSVDGPYTKLNAALIPAQGGPTWGASYSFDDTTAANGATYYYKLEDVDVHAVSVFHGPVSASQTPTAVQVVDFHASGASPFVPLAGLVLGVGVAGGAWVWQRRRR